MKSKLVPAAVCTTCAFLALNSLFESRGQAAGSLDPPAGSPAPNMVTLGELSRQLGELQSRFDARLPGGKNLAIGSSDGTVSAWDHETGSWTSFSLGGVIGPVTESNGNFLFINSVGSAAAWSSTTKTWRGVSFPAAAISNSGGSNGNFFLATNKGSVAAFNKTTGQWVTHQVSGFIVGTAGSEGNILITTSTGIAAIWNQTTGAWTTRDFGNVLIAVGSDGDLR